MSLGLMQRFGIKKKPLQVRGASLPLFFPDSKLSNYGLALPAGVINQSPALILVLTFMLHSFLFLRSSIKARKVTGKRHIIKRFLSYAI
jgi:hypothetical protein